MSKTITQKSSSVPTPLYILRGHVSPIHALHFFNSNLRLVSADADGWIIVWDMVSKRAVAVWKAHDGGVLEVKGFHVSYPGSGSMTEVYTHGRDHKLRLWRFSARDEEILDKTLPVDQTERPQSEAGTRSQPWLLHSLAVNALNFCPFSIVFLNSNKTQAETEEEAEAPRPVLIAVPNALNSGAVDIFHLPHEKRVCTIPAAREEIGMVMAVSIFFNPNSSGALYVCSAYEDGHVMVFACRNPSPNSTGFQELEELINGKNNNTPWQWERLYSNRPHSQPILGIDVSPSKEYFLSSSADAVLGMHPIPSLPLPALSTGSLIHGVTVTGESGSISVEQSPLKIVNTKHAGQQGVRIRSDGRIFATAGWDYRVRVYSCKTMKELAVLKWHKDGCFTVSFAEIFGSGDGETASSDISRQEHSLAALQRQRYHKVQSTHWLAAGSKDGKISLWDIY
ncbi:ASTRA complex subunit [Monascus purpureus]|uniref:ASTRA-associated protein 1 n=1 Tax=Monascus purpureus TaxID=5098 RepID=A0A507QXQ7_MONPU|nr:ASTRA complex subunit [Monascus purpureus]BDD62715.1 hypothetical protein MAP00_007675 [Monascus purpureus]